MTNLKYPNLSVIMDSSMNKIQINFLRPERNLSFEPEKKPHNKKWLIIFFISFCVLAFGSGCIAKKIILAKWPDNPTEYDAETLQPKKTGLFQTVKNFLFSPENVLEGQKEDRINILLLGIGGSGHDGPYLSDTSIILSVNPKTNEEKYINVKSCPVYIELKNIFKELEKRRALIVQTNIDKSLEYCCTIPTILNIWIKYSLISDFAGYDY